MYGFNTVSIDPKGRIAIPAKYRNYLEKTNEKIISITRDPQYPSLKVYFGSQWEQISNHLESLQSLDPVVRKIQWTILGNASVNEFDPSGRMLVNIPTELREYAEIYEKNNTGNFKLSICIFVVSTFYFLLIMVLDGIWVTDKPQNITHHVSHDLAKNNTE